MKLKKLFTMSIAAIMAVSAMSISAMAKEEIALENGVIMTVYAPGESVDDAYSKTRAAISNAPFSVTVPKYPNYTYVELNSGVSEILLNGQDCIKLTFNTQQNKYTSGYQGIYDCDLHKFLKDMDGNDFSGPFQIGSTLSFSNLTDGHSYKIALATNSGSRLAVGTLSTLRK